MASRRRVLSSFSPLRPTRHASTAERTASAAAWEAFRAAVAASLAALDLAAACLAAAFFNLFASAATEGADPCRRAISASTRASARLKRASSSAIVWRSSASVSDCTMDGLPNAFKMFRLLSISWPTFFIFASTAQSSADAHRLSPVFSSRMYSWPVSGSVYLVRPLFLEGDRMDDVRFWNALLSFRRASLLQATNEKSLPFSTRLTAAASTKAAYNAPINDAAARQTSCLGSCLSTASANDAISRASNTESSRAPNLATNNAKVRRRADANFAGCDGWPKTSAACLRASVSSRINAATGGGLGKTAAAINGAPSHGVRANLDTQRAATRAALLEAA